MAESLHDMEAEQSLLRSILLDYRTTVGALSELTAEDFYSPIHKRAFVALQDAYNKRAATIQAEMRRRGKEEIGREYIDALIASPPMAADMGQHLRAIREKTRLRRRRT
jgi:replicative DNA helicase